MLKIEGGSNKSLFTLIAVVIFGIFLSLSYWLFQDEMKGVLGSVLDGVGMKVDGLYEPSKEGLVINIDASDYNNSLRLIDSEGVVANNFAGTKLSGYDDSDNTLVFDGVDDYLDLGMAPALDNTVNFSWEIYVKVNTYQINRVIMGNRYPLTSTSEFNFMKITPNQFEVNGYFISNTVPQSNWLHIVVVKEGKDYRYYVNGILIKESVLNITRESRPLYIGADFGLGLVNEPISMKLRYARVYNRPLSDMEILQNYNSLY